MVVVESLAHALARGATPIAEILGGALTADAFHISAPEPTGRGATRAMSMAREHAGVTADEIDWIVAHGTSTPLNDVTETRAIKASFGAAASKVAISSPKSMIGHLVGAAGIASALAALGGIRDQVISPTANHENPDLPECDLDYVPLRRAGGEDRHGHGQRLRLRGSERGCDLPSLRRIAPGRRSPGVPSGHGSRPSARVAPPGRRGRGLRRPAVARHARHALLGAPGPRAADPSARVPGGAGHGPPGRRARRPDGRLPGGPRGHEGGRDPGRGHRLDRRRRPAGHRDGTRG